MNNSHGLVWVNRQGLFGIGARDEQCFLALAHGQLFKKVPMLRIGVFLESGDASEEFFDRHAFQDSLWRLLADQSGQYR